MTAEQLWERKHGILAVAVVVGVIAWLAFMKYAGPGGAQGVGELTYIDYEREGKVYEVTVRESDNGSRIFREFVGPKFTPKTQKITGYKKKDRFVVIYKRDSYGKYHLVEIGEPR